MTSDGLFPTKTRLQLLRDIDEGLVLVDRYGQAAYADTDGAPWGLRATARWNEAARAGWAERPAGDDPKWMPARLTDAGRTVLEAADGH